MVRRDRRGQILETARVCPIRVFRMFGRSTLDRLNQGAEYSGQLEFQSTSPSLDRPPMRYRAVGTSYRVGRTLPDWRQIA